MSGLSHPSDSQVFLTLINYSLSEFIRQQSRLQERLDATTVVAACFKDGNKAKWIQGLVKDALVSYDVAQPDDVPTLLRLAQELTPGGIKILQSKYVGCFGAVPVFEGIH